MWPFKRKAHAAQTTPLADATRGQHPTTVQHLLTLAGYTYDQVGYTIGRAECNAVPALKSIISLYCSIANRLPLVMEDIATGEKVEKDHRSQSWLDTLDPEHTRGWTIVQTVLDLIYEKVAFWEVTAYNAQGFPAESRHLDQTLLQIVPPSHDHPRGQILYDNVPLNLKDVIRFDGITEGLLSSSTHAAAVRMAYANVKAASNYATKPLPAWFMTDQEGADPLEDDDATSALENVDNAVANRGSAYVSGVQLQSMSWNAREIQLVEARAADAVDMARIMSAPTKYAAAPAQGQELVYTNMVEIRRDLYETGGLATYLPVIEDRLSMPDCTPRGKRVRFDPDSFFSQVVENPVTPGGQRENGGTVTGPGQLVSLPVAARRAEARTAIALYDDTLGDGLARVTAADAERRVIEGLIVPWNEVGYASLDGRPQKQVYLRDSLTWETDKDGHPDLPLVVDHTGQGPRVFAGWCQKVWSDDEGLHGSWKILPTRAGDDALAEAGAHGDPAVRRGLSLECLIPAEASIDPESDILTVTAEHPALLERTAMVDRPAFNKAGVSRAVAAEATAKPAAAAEVPDETLSTTIAALNDAVQGLTQVATDLQGSLNENAGVADPAAEQPVAASRPNPAGAATASTKVTREEFPYGPDHTDRGFFHDLYQAGRNPNSEKGRAAADRVDKAHTMWQDLGVARAKANPQLGAPGYATAANEPIPQANVFVPNQYDVGLFVNEIVFPRKLTDAAPKTTITGPNPFLYPKLASGPVADGGSGEVITAHSEGTNPAAGEADIDAITATPLPYSGTFDINREAVDGASPGMDQILFGWLKESYNRVTELAFWTALYATSGITSPTSVTTDADLAVEARAMLKQIRGEQAAFDVRRGVGPDRIFFGSGVWSAALEAESASASGEPLYPYYNPTNRDAASTNNQTVQVAVRGTIGESAAQATSAKVTQVRFADLHVWEGSAGLFRWEEVAGPAKIRFSLFNYFVGKVIQPKGVTVHTQA